MKKVIAILSIATFIVAGTVNAQEKEAKEHHGKGEHKGEMKNEKEGMKKENEGKHNGEMKGKGHGKHDADAKKAEAAPAQAK